MDGAKSWWDSPGLTPGLTPLCSTIFRCFGINMHNEGPPHMSDPDEHYYTSMHIACLLERIIHTVNIDRKIHGGFKPIFLHLPSKFTGISTATVIVTPFPVNLRLSKINKFFLWYQLRIHVPKVIPSGIPLCRPPWSIGMKCKYWTPINHACSIIKTKRLMLGWFILSCWSRNSQFDHTFVRGRDTPSI